MVLIATPNKGSPVIDRIKQAGLTVVPIGPDGSWHARGSAVGVAATSTPHTEESIGVRVEGPWGRFGPWVDGFSADGDDRRGLTLTPAGHGGTSTPVEEV